MTPHTGYIVAAYAFAAVTVISLIVWSLLDHRAQRRALADLEARLGPEAAKPNRGKK